MLSLGVSSGRRPTAAIRWRSSILALAALGVRTRASTCWHHLPVVHIQVRHLIHHLLPITHLWSSSVLWWIAMPKLAISRTHGRTVHDMSAGFW
jgi:hypothetical protein